MNFWKTGTPLFRIMRTMAEIWRTTCRSVGCWGRLSRRCRAPRWRKTSPALASAWWGAPRPGADVGKVFRSRPVSMVGAAGAGGPIDVFTRIMAERMSPILGQRVVVENVGGGGGTLGGQRVAKAEPDGYTTLLVPIPTHANPQLYCDKALCD